MIDSNQVTFRLVRPAPGARAIQVHYANLNGIDASLLPEATPVTTHLPLYDTLDFSSSLSFHRLRDRVFGVLVFIDNSRRKRFEEWHSIKYQTDLGSLHLRGLHDFHRFEFEAENRRIGENAVGFRRHFYQGYTCRQPTGDRMFDRVWKTCVPSSTLSTVNEGLSFTVSLVFTYRPSFSTSVLSNFGSDGPASLNNSKLHKPSWTLRVHDCSKFS